MLDAGRRRRRLDGSRKLKRYLIKSGLVHSPLNYSHSRTRGSKTIEQDSSARCTRKAGREQRKKNRDFFFYELNGVHTFVLHVCELYIVLSQKMIHVKM
jgi:hypothetical protein